MTFSIAAVCKQTGETGCAVSSSSICVTSRCAFVGPGGAVLTQNVTNPALGIKAIKLLSDGVASQLVIDTLLQEEHYPQWRQLLVVDSRGRSAIFDGEKALGIVGRAQGDGCVAAGNLLADSRVPEAMVEAFENAEGLLADRLMLAMQAGVVAGGEAGPVFSAGLRVARPSIVWPIIDLRVDWHESPIDTLRDNWLRYAPQLEDYVMRAANPDAAPSYGVPGE
ncbi:DUF1028 domain-containing protein [Vreelandella olivaria]|uniref:DUF1028 domain-containing protein n=1 Tax=Vreelandella olivaria TaxID=390919 RepID=UPI00201E85C5